MLVADRLAPLFAPAWLPLTPDDRARLAGFRVEDDARRFLTGRILVHRHLNETRNLPYGTVRFERRITNAGEWKPVLVPAQGRAIRLALPEVSISHSGRYVAVAFSSVLEVGIDIEQHASFADGADDALAHALTETERDALRGPVDAARAFTAKEAVLKAVGYGFAIDPLRVEIRGGSVTRFDAPQRRPVSLAEVPIAGAVSATVAVAGGPPTRPFP